MVRSQGRHEDEWKPCPPSGSLDLTRKRFSQRREEGHESEPTLPAVAAAQGLGCGTLSDLEARATVLRRLKLAGEDQGGAKPAAPRSCGTYPAAAAARSSGNSAASASSLTCVAALSRSISSSSCTTVSWLTCHSSVETS
jgi:hypothetical protein